MKFTKLKYRGFVTVSYHLGGRLIWEKRGENLIVTAALGPIAQLVGGSVTGNSVSVVGFGSGTAAPTIGDTALSAAPAYYKPIASVSFPQAGKAEFTWQITGSSDTGAVGINVQEIGFFCNPNALALPITQASGAAAPALTMYGHILMAVGVIASSGTYSGTWTFVA